MKKATTKAIVLTACAAVLIVATILGTLAYLTSRDSVTNTFTVGQVQITLDEAQVDEYGKPVTPANRVEGNNYKLIPGMTYTKDPTVHIQPGSEDSYIRMIVTVTDLANLKTALGVTGTFYPQNFVENWDPTVWHCAAMSETANDTGVYEFRYIGDLDGNSTDSVAIGTSSAALSLEPLFTGFTLPGSVTGDAVAALSDMSINIEAHAIQSATFADADAAWAAFDAQMGTANP